MAVKGRPGAKHKTKLDREATMERVARLERMGYSTRQIGERLGFSHVQISLYEKELKRRYTESQLDNRAALVEEAADRYREIKGEAREAWDRSQRSEDDDVRRAGDAAFLKVMMDCEKAERELRGLDAPTKQDVRAAVVGVNVARAEGLPRAESGVVDWSALSGRPPVTDPVDDAEVRPALPPHVNGRNGKHKEK
jgi:hypothetical protein